MTNLSKSIIVSFIFSLTGCFNNYDPELETPDGHGGGYNLTPLGCLLWTPFTCDENDSVFNVQILKDNKEISSVGYRYSDVQKELVFELQRNGTVNYWFKSDYIKSPTDTITILDGQKALSHTIYHGEQIKPLVRHYYTTGRWVVNFKDSSLMIDFGQNHFGLTPFKGKFSSLGAGRMSLQQTLYFDSLIDGKKQALRKNINVYYQGF